MQLTLGLGICVQERRVHDEAVHASLQLERHLQWLVQVIVDVLWEHVEPMIVLQEMELRLWQCVIGGVLLWWSALSRTPFPL